MFIPIDDLILTTNPKNSGNLGRMKCLSVSLSKKLYNPGPAPLKHENLIYAISAVKTEREEPPKKRLF